MFINVVRLFSLLMPKTKIYEFVAQKEFMKVQLLLSFGGFLTCRELNMTSN